MAACHTLLFKEGEILGDSLELEMFSKSGYKFQNNLFVQNVKVNFEIIKIHQFTSENQRMSVIIKDSN